MHASKILLASLNSVKWDAVGHVFPNHARSAFDAGSVRHAKLWKLPKQPVSLCTTKDFVAPGVGAVCFEKIRSIARDMSDDCICLAIQSGIVRVETNHYYEIVVAMAFHKGRLTVHSSPIDKSEQVLLSEEKLAEKVFASALARDQYEPGLVHSTVISSELALYF
jgi:non-canonical (house-cleaning) NTP pyrophosphatase